MTKPSDEQPGEALRIWYMRDNHTFRSLPLDVEAAVLALRQEFDVGETYGILFSKHPRVKGCVHAANDWPAFEAAARKWLAVAVSEALDAIPFAREGGAMTKPDGDAHAECAAEIAVLRKAVQQAHDFLNRDATYVGATIHLTFESHGRAVKALAGVRQTLRAALAGPNGPSYRTGTTS